MLLAPSICNDRHEAMSYSLVEAATACGVNRSTVLRAIRAGKISAGKDEQGEWRIEAVEPPPRLSTRADARGTLRAGASRRTDRWATYRPGRHAARSWRAAGAGASSCTARAQGRTSAAKTRARTDRAALTLVSRRWMRAAGCLAGAGLLLALSTVPAGAQQQQPRNNRRRRDASRLRWATAGRKVIDVWSCMMWWCTSKHQPSGSLR